MGIKNLRYDDLDNSITDDVEPVEITYDGSTYSIDLGQKNRAKLDDAIRPFLDAGTRKGGLPTKAPSQKRPGILAWARDEGLVSPTHRGRLPQTVLDAYDAAH